MASNEYICVAGMVQFDPRERVAAGKNVRDVLVRVANGGNKEISVTVWDDFSHVPIKRGDYLVADGSYSQNAGQNKAGEAVTYHNLSASMLVVIPGSEKGGSAPTKAKAAAAPAEISGGDDLPF